MTANHKLAWASELGVDRNHFYYVNVNFWGRFVKHVTIVWGMLHILIICVYLFGYLVLRMTLRGDWKFDLIITNITLMCVIMTIPIGMAWDDRKDFNLLYQLKDAKRFKWIGKQTYWGCTTEFIRFPKDPNLISTRIGRLYSE